MRIELEIQESNKETLSSEFLDYLLYLTLKASRDEPPENRSIVVAGIYDQESNGFYVASARQIDNETAYGRRNHAEHEAMSLASENRVNLSKAIAVTTLGPCLKESKTRDHDSCTNLLIKAGIKRVHVGVLDHRQADIALYKKMGLTVTTTSDPMMLSICEGLNNYFNPEKNERLVGLDKAGYINKILKNFPEEQ